MLLVLFTLAGLCHYLLTVAIAVSNGFHPMYDRYGIFAYVPSDKTLDDLIQVTEEKNNRWQEVVNIVTVDRKSRALMVCYLLFPC